jgi:hypothetical protein
LKETENEITVPGERRQTTSGETGTVNLAHTPQRPSTATKIAREEFKFIM